MIFLVYILSLALVASNVNEQVDAAPITPTTGHGTAPCALHRVPRVVPLPPTFTAHTQVVKLNFSGSTSTPHVTATACLGDTVRFQWVYATHPLVQLELVAAGPSGCASVWSTQYGEGKREGVPSCGAAVGNQSSGAYVDVVVRRLGPSPYNFTANVATEGALLSKVMIEGVDCVCPRINAIQLPTLLTTANPTNAASITGYIDVTVKVHIDLHTFFSACSSVIPRSTLEALMQMLVTPLRVPEAISRTSLTRPWVSSADPPARSRRDLSLQSMWNSAMGIGNSAGIATEGGIRHHQVSEINDLLLASLQAGTTSSIIRARLTSVDETLLQGIHDVKISLDDLQSVVASLFTTSTGTTLCTTQLAAIVGEIRGWSMQLTNGHHPAPLAAAVGVQLGRVLEDTTPVESVGTHKVIHSAIHYSSNVTIVTYGVRIPLAESLGDYWSALAVVGDVDGWVPLLMPSAMNATHLWVGDTIETQETLLFTRGALVERRSWANQTAFIRSKQVAQVVDLHNGTVCVSGDAVLETHGHICHSGNAICFVLTTTTAINGHLYSPPITVGLWTSPLAMQPLLDSLILPEIVRAQFDRLSAQRDQYYAKLSTGVEVLISDAKTLENLVAKDLNDAKARSRHITQELNTESWWAAITGNPDGSVTLISWIRWAALLAAFIILAVGIGALCSACKNKRHLQEVAQIDY